MGLGFRDKYYGSGFILIQNFWGFGLWFVQRFVCLKFGESTPKNLSPRSLDSSGLKDMVVRENRGTLIQYPK